MIRAPGSGSQATAGSSRSRISGWVQRGLYRLLYPVTCILLAGCSSAPPPPDWKIDAHGLLESYAKHYLDGNTRLAERNFEKAWAQIARTGRLDLVARAELHRCAIRGAALEIAPCTGYDALASHAGVEEAAYARFLTGDWSGLAADKLPSQYAGLLKAKDEAALGSALADIRDPVSRAIAAGILFRTGRASPGVIAEATRTASEQGWRRPLLAWLRIQAERAETAGDRMALEVIRARIELVQGSLPRTDR